MRFEVSRCYEVQLHGKVSKFRVVRNDSGHVTVRHCETKENESLNNILIGDISNIKVQEFDCMDCDGQPSPD